jgi:hypothetical protein
MMTARLAATPFGLDKKGDDRVQNAQQQGSQQNESENNGAQRDARPFQIQQWIIATVIFGKIGHRPNYNSFFSTVPNV